MKQECGATKILKTIGNIKCDFSSLKSGNIKDIKRLYTCTSCGCSDRNKISFEISDKHNFFIRYCAECKFKEHLKDYKRLIKQK